MILLNYYNKLCAINVVHKHDNDTRKTLVIESSANKVLLPKLAGVYSHDYWHPDGCENKCALSILLSGVSL